MTDRPFENSDTSELQNNVDVWSVTVESIRDDSSKKVLTKQIELAKEELKRRLPEKQLLKG